MSENTHQAAPLPFFLPSNKLSATPAKAGVQLRRRPTISATFLPVRQQESGCFLVSRASSPLLLKGGRKSGLWHMLGDPANAPVLLIAEGYSTSASLHEASGRPVAMAIDAGNMAHVARALRKLHPDALLVLCGDDDVQTSAKTG